MTGFFDEAGKGVAFARRSDPDTSHAAAEDELQRAVLEYAADRGASGFTDVSLNAHFGTHSSTYRTRRAELVDLGLVADSGERRRCGEGGRLHAVWVITDEGADRLRALAA